MPHMDGDRIVDKVHTVNPPKPTINRDDLDACLAEIEKKEYARMVGLVSHLVYWSVFGHINQVALDPFYKKSLFVTVAQLKSEFETRYISNRKFMTFIMPCLVLVIRIEMEVIFKNMYPLFFSTPENSVVSL